MLDLFLYMTVVHCSAAHSHVFDLTFSFFQVGFDVSLFFQAILDFVVE